jgi:hypothetical protein
MIRIPKAVIRFESIEFCQSSSTVGTTVRGESVDGLRNYNRLKLETSEELLIILEEYKEYTLQ